MVGSSDFLPYQDFPLLAIELTHRLLGDVHFNLSNFYSFYSDSEMYSS